MKATPHTLPLVTLITLLVVAGSARAQQPVSADPSRIQMTRDELTELLQQYESAQQTSAYTLPFRSRVGAQVRMIRQRLAQGDFQAGDQIVLGVRGEPQLTDTFTVQPGPVVELPGIGAISLRGVLRSEMQSRLTSELARYIRDPEVEAHTLFRITVSGSVGQAGYYVVPAQALVSEVIMSAGGFAAGADLTGIQIVREGGVIWSGRDLQQAIAEGRTFDQLNLASGDHMIVPAQGGGLVRSILLIVPSIALTITGLRTLLF